MSVFDGFSSNHSPSTKTQPFAFALLLVCFFLSGLAGLIYQSAWSVEFALVFGTSELAIATVLAAYMTGLAGGAAVAGRMGRRIQNPVWVYALLELGIALAALAVPFAINSASTLQVSLFGTEELGTGHSPGLLLYDLIASFVILILPTGLMGATLPLLARHVVKTDRQIGPRIGLLYTTNTIGAAAGALLAAYWFLPSLGLGRTLWMAVGANALVFVAAALLSRHTGGHLPQVESTRTVRFKGAGLILPLMALSGALSFTLEILWTRLLGQVLGGTVYAFGIMLTTFLFGIALGSAVASRLATKASRALIWFAACQVGVACGTVIAFLLADKLPGWVETLGSDFKSLLWTGSVLGMATLMPAALFSGATFPLAVKVFARDATDAGGASAQVFAWNTFGAILGAIGSGYFLIPALGFSGTVATVASCSMLLALIATIWWGQSTQQKRHPVVWSAAALLLLAIGVLQVMSLPEPWHLLRSSALNRKPAITPVHYFEVGRSASVMVAEQGPDWRISTNGLPESIIQAPESRASRLAVARWLSLLPLAARPAATDYLVIGFGAGVTVENLPQGIESVQVVELEPAVIRANRAFRDKRRIDPLADPRVSVHFNDARSALLLSQKQYDAIVSQPSHPWTSAASHLFTKEFFQVVAQKLKPDGVFVQWIGLRFVDDHLLETLIATLKAVFPEVEVYSPGGRNAVLFLASNQPLLTEESLNQTFKQAGEQWAEVSIHVPEDIMLARILDNQGSQVIAERAQVSTDRRNLLKIGSPKIIYGSHKNPDLDMLSDGLDPLAKGLVDEQRFYLLDKMLQFGLWARARRLAGQMEDPIHQKVAQGMIALGENRRRVAAQLMTRAQIQKPEHAWVEKALFRLFKGTMLKNGLPLKVELNLSPAARDLFKAWQAEKQGKWTEVQQLDARFAALDKTHPFYLDGLRLRVGWRLLSGEQEHWFAAKSLVIQAMGFGGNGEDVVKRMHTGMLIQDAELVRTGVADLQRLSSSRNRKNNPQWVKMLMQQLRQIVMNLDEPHQTWLAETFPHLLSDLDLSLSSKEPHATSPMQ